MFRGALWVCLSLLVSTHAWAEEGVESPALLATASTSEAGLAPFGNVSVQSRNAALGILHSERPFCRLKVPWPSLL